MSGDVGPLQDEDLQQRIKNYVATEHPDTALEVIAQLAEHGASPEHREFIEAVIDGDDVSHVADSPSRADTLDVIEVSPDREAPGAPKKEAARDAEDSPTDTDKRSNPDTSTTDRVPGPLAKLGAVFAPVQPGEKRCYHSRDAEDLYAAGDEDLEIYLHSGFNYAVLTRGDLAALDADDPEALKAVIDALPETAWQVTGSRESECYFLQVPGLDEDLPLEDPETGENIGHVKAAAKSYVVGPLVGRLLNDSSGGGVSRF